MLIPRFTVYTKTSCGWCDDALDWLNKHEFAYDEVNVSDDAAAFAELLRISGQTLCPTLVADDAVLPDFDTGQLAVFFKEHGWLAAA